MGERVYLSLGSNQGDRKGNLRDACARLGELLPEARVSSLYETEPMYLREQPRFLNAVFSGLSGMDAWELLRELQAIEAALGRVRSVPKGPRTLDIDLLLYGTELIRAEGLVVPHPGLTERAFVLVPLLELEPELLEPLTGKPYRAYLDSLTTRGVSYVGPLDA